MYCTALLGCADNRLPPRLCAWVGHVLAGAHQARVTSLEGDQPVPELTGAMMPRAAPASHQFPNIVPAMDGFATEDEMTKAVSAQWMQARGVHFPKAAAATSTTEALSSYKLRYSPDLQMQDFPSTTRLGPRPTYSIWGTLTFGFYQGKGLSQLMDMLDRAITSVQKGHLYFMMPVFTLKMPTPDYTSGHFIYNVRMLLPLLVVLLWIYSVGLTTKSLVKEKEERACESQTITIPSLPFFKMAQNLDLRRVLVPGEKHISNRVLRSLTPFPLPPFVVAGLHASLKLMGMNDVTNWAGWFVATYGLTMLTSFAMAVLLKYGRIMEQTDFSLLLCFLTLYGLSIVSLSFFFSVFFTKARVASACAGQ